MVGSQKGVTVESEENVKVFAFSQSIRPAFANYDNIEELNNPSPYFPGLVTGGGNIGEPSDGGSIRPEDLYSKITSVASRYQDDCGIHIQITNANTVFQLIAWLVLAEGATGRITDKNKLPSIFPEIKSFTSRYKLCHFFQSLQLT